MIMPKSKSCLPIRSNDSDPNFLGLNLEHINRILQFHRFPNQPFWVTRKISAKVII